LYCVLLDRHDVLNLLLLLFLLFQLLCPRVTIINEEFAEHKLNSRLCGVPIIKIAFIAQYILITVILHINVTNLTNFQNGKARKGHGRTVQDRSFSWSGKLSQQETHPVPCVDALWFSSPFFCWC